MAEYYLYADDTGNPDLAGKGEHGSSAYFGFGTAVFEGDHGDALMSGLAMRAAASRHGLELPRGFHATDDSARTRAEVFSVTRNHPPRFNTAFLLEDNADSRIRDHSDPEMRLYRMAWYLHLRQVADHDLGATHRALTGRECRWYEDDVKPHLKTSFTPWGTLSTTRATP